MDNLATALQLAQTRARTNQRKIDRFNELLHEGVYLSLAKLETVLKKAASESKLGSSRSKLTSSSLISSESTDALSSSSWFVSFYPSSDNSSTSSSIDNETNASTAETHSSVQLPKNCVEDTVPDRYEASSTQIGDSEEDDTNDVVTRALDEFTAIAEFATPILMHSCSIPASSLKSALSPTAESTSTHIECGSTLSFLQASDLTHSQRHLISVLLPKLTSLVTAADLTASSPSSCSESNPSPMASAARAATKTMTRQEALQCCMLLFHALHSVAPKNDTKDSVPVTNRKERNKRLQKPIPSRSGVDALWKERSHYKNLSQLQAKRLQACMRAFNKLEIRSKLLQERVKYLKNYAQQAKDRSQYYKNLIVQHNIQVTNEFLRPEAEPNDDSEVVDSKDLTTFLPSCSLSSSPSTTTATTATTVTGLMPSTADPSSANSTSVTSISSDSTYVACILRRLAIDRLSAPTIIMLGMICFILANNAKRIGRWYYQKLRPMIRSFAVRS